MICAEAQFISVMDTSPHSALAAFAAPMNAPATSAGSFIENLVIGPSFERRRQDREDSRLRDSMASIGRKKRAVNAFFRPRSRNSNPPRAIALSPKKSRGPSLSNIFSTRTWRRPARQTSVGMPNRGDSKHAPFRLRLGVRNAVAASPRPIRIRESAAGKSCLPKALPRLPNGHAAWGGCQFRPSAGAAVSFEDAAAAPSSRFGSCNLVDHAERAACRGLETRDCSTALDILFRYGSRNRFRALRRIGVRGWRGDEHGNDFRCAPEAGSTPERHGTVAKLASSSIIRERIGACVRILPLFIDRRTHSGRCRSTPLILGKYRGSLAIGESPRIPTLTGLESRICH